MSSAPTMTRRPRKRQARKRAKPVMLFNKRLRVGKTVELGGGLVAELQLSSSYAGPRPYCVQLTLRTRGAGDLVVLLPEWRETAQAAAKHTEETMLHLASALRVAGAS